MKLAFSGLSGRLGQAFLSCLPDYPEHEVVFGLGRTPDPKAKVPIFSNFASNFSKVKTPVDVLIDFSSPEFFLACLHECPSTLKAVISGTTGFTPMQLSELQAVSKNKFVFHANNFSIGITALIKSIQSIGGLLQDWEVLIQDIHHAQKRDAPSGTAKWMLQTLKDAGGAASPRMESLRIGQATGEHSITFNHTGETLSLRHESKDQAVYIHGMFTILEWIEQTERWRSPGFYGMEDYFQSISGS